MNIIEAMARALWDSASIEQTPWLRSFDEQPDDVKRRLCNDMRAALIALRDHEKTPEAVRVWINAILEEG